MTGRHRPTAHRRLPQHRAHRGPTAGERRDGGRGILPWLGAAAAAAVAVVGLPGTYAFWTAQGTLATETFTSGVLDVRLSGDDGNPVAWSNAALTLAGMLPGESLAVDFPVQNVGNVPLKYTATVSGTGGLSGYLTLEAFPTGSASNATSGGLRTGTCTGVGQGPTSIPGTVVGTTQSVPAGGSQQLCLVVTLVATAPSSVQGQSGSATMTFSAIQETAP